MKPLKLPHFIGEQLYVIPDIQSPKMDVPVEKFKVIIFVDRKTEALSEMEKETIDKMMKGVGCQDSYHLIGVDSNEVPMIQILKNTGANYILSFGLRPSNLSLNVNPIANEVLHLGKEKILFSESVSLFESVEKKKLLWSRLKIMFEIN